MKNSAKINKEELHSIFEGIAKNDETCFNELYEKYHWLVYNIAFSILKNQENSEEIMQKVFVKIWKMEKDKLPTKFESSWLYTLTKNETLNFTRNNKIEQNIDDIYYISDQDIEINKIIDQDSYNRIISKLNSQEQEIVSLKIISNLSFKQISQVLNISEGTVKWRYYKSIHTLKLLLGNLAMFIITFAIGVKTIFVSRKKATEITDGVKKNEIVQDSAINEEQKDLESSESNRKDKENVTNDNIIKEDEKQEDVTQNVVIENSSNINDYYKIGITSISAIFLILTIIFTIIFAKYQLKGRKKASK